MKKKIILIVVSVLISYIAKAQSINLEFPYFAGKTYEFTIFQGDKRVKLKEGSIPKGGKVQLRIPESFKGYKGMAQCI